MLLCHFVKQVIQRISSFFKGSSNDETKHKELIDKLNKIIMTLEELLLKVTDERTKVGSLIALTNGIKKQLDDILSGALTPDQQAKVAAVFAVVEAEQTDVQAALDANTTPPAPSNN